MVCAIVFTGIILSEKLGQLVLIPRGLYFVEHCLDDSVLAETERKGIHAVELIRSLSNPLFLWFDGCNVTQPLFIDQVSLAVTHIYVSLFVCPALVRHMLCMASDC